MAVIYLGDNNNKPKKINNFYIGIKSTPKKIVNAYIGTKSGPKLFYTIYTEKYPTLKHLTPSEEYWLYFANTSSHKDWEKCDLDDSLDGIWYSPSGTTLKTNAVRFYLNKNSSNFLKKCYNIILSGWGASSRNNIEDQFLFNKVENLSHFVGEYSHYYKGNPKNLNFSNVINMSEAFNGAYSLIGNPQSGPKVTNMHNCYRTCHNLSGKVAIGKNVIDASGAYFMTGYASDHYLNLGDISVGETQGINLYQCFESTNVFGTIYIYNYTNLHRFCYDRTSGKWLNIHMPSSSTLKQINTSISSMKLVNSKETHVINSTGGYIDIRSSEDKPYYVRIYNDIK